MKFKFSSQLEMVDCGPACLKMILNFYGKNYSLSILRDLCSVTRAGVSLQDIAKGADKLGFDTLTVRISVDELSEMPLPCILHWNQDHFVVLYDFKRVKNDIVFFIADPGFGKMKLNQTDFIKGWYSNDNKGIALLLETNDQFDHVVINEKKEDNFLEIKTFVKKYLKDHKIRISTISVLLLTSVIISWIYPFLLRIIIDEGVNKKNINFIITAILAQLSLFVGQIVIESVRSIISSHLSNVISKDMISSFIGKLSKLPIKFFDTKLHTDIIQRIEDHSHIEGFLTYMVIQFIFSLFTLIIMSFQLAIYQLYIFLIFLFFSILSISWTTLFLQKRKFLDYRRFRIRADYRNILLETISGMSEIKINNAQEKRINSINTLQDEFYDLNITNTKVSQYQQLGSNSINQFKNIIITFLCAFWVVKGSLTLGEMMSITYIVGLLNSPIENFISFFRSGQDAKIAFSRLNEIQKKEDETNTKKSTSELQFNSEILFKNVSFKYEINSNRFILKNINLTIPKSKITAIVGTSGSGKSTLFKLILNFYNPTVGDIFLDNTDMQFINNNEWRSKCGVVMQDGFIYSGTIAENIALADNFINKDKLLFASESACILDFINSLPLGFDTKIGNSGIQLSGGQKQRILIARAIYKNPEVLLLDEATNSLDSSNESNIVSNLNNFFQGRTVLIIAHRLSTVRNADNIIVLSEGEIVEQGTHDKLIENRKYYYNLVVDQLEIAEAN